MAAVCCGRSTFTMCGDQALFLVQIILFFQVLECAVYPSIHWSPQNPLFDRNDSVIYVLPMSRLHIVCPNPTTVIRRVKDSTSKNKLYQNLWIVSRENYERCNTDFTKESSSLLLQCNSPLQLKYYTLVFQKYSAISSLVYIPGEEYYFIATSDGTPTSLNWRSGGNCQRANMKLRIRLCLNNKDPRCTSRATATTRTATTIRSARTTIKATTEIRSTGTTSQSTILSSTASSTSPHTRKATTDAPIGAIQLPTSLPTTLPESQTSPSLVTRTMERVTQGVVVARASSSDRAADRSLLDAVSGINWIVIIPLMACLLLSLLGNIILICRLRFRQQDYELQEKGHKIVETASVKRLEPPTTELARVEKTLLWFKKSADATEV